METSLPSSSKRATPPSLSQTLANRNLAPRVYSNHIPSPPPKPLPKRVKAGGLLFLIPVLTALVVTIGSFLVEPVAPPLTSYAIHWPRNNDKTQKVQKVLSGVKSFLTTKANGRSSSAFLDSLARTIVSESAKADLHPLLVATIIYYESSFNPRALSFKGAKGLMQVMPDTGAWIARRVDHPWQNSQQLYDPSQNVKLGISYLKTLEKLFPGNWEHVLIAYNWGPGNLQVALKNEERIPREPRLYASRILKEFWKASKKYSKGNV